MTKSLIDVRQSLRLRFEQRGGRLGSIFRRARDRADLSYLDTALNRCIKDLKSRLKQKTEAGLELDETEEHLEKSWKQILRHNFGPFPPMVFADVFLTTIRPFLLLLGPLMIISFLFIIPSSEWRLDEYLPERLSRISKALISKDKLRAGEFPPEERPLPKESSKNILKDENQLFLENELAGAIEGEKKGRTAATEFAVESNANAKTRASLVNFLSGIISIYHPRINNPGNIGRLIVEISVQEKADPLYIASIVSVESGFSTRARSRVGAQGLMQLMPATAKELATLRLGKKVNFSINDPRTNILLGVIYIKDLERRYKGNRHYALSAYNWGLANVDASIKNGSPIPKAVSRYALTILQRTIQWRKNLENSQEETARLERNLAKKNVY